MDKRYDAKKREVDWLDFWEKEKVYAFDPSSKSEIYSIDTPPPTVSGKMHLGHSFSFSQQDFIARYHRMKGKNVFYPFGTDDNGLATEKLVEKLKKVNSRKMSRDDFIKLCLDTLEEFRGDFVYDWKRIGISSDYSIFYSTINEHSRKISQRSFIELYEKDRIYRKYAAVMTCPKCATAIAQVELEDLERESVLYHVKAKVEGMKELVFATTRPELMMACIAISVHPDDERYKQYVGKKAVIPGSHAEVPIITDTMTKMEFGSGVVYWCPYGDVNDIEFVAKHPELTVKNIMNRDGKLNSEAGKYEGLNSMNARAEVVKDWKDAIVKEEKIKQVVNIHERCGTPIEFVALDQWFIKYLDLKEQLLDYGKRMNWYPKHMRVRYDNWIHGLKWDWNISRQRHFGVPIPVWYCKKCEQVKLASLSELPVDPIKDKPKGKCKCGSTEFIGEKDVLDTWATSSLSPQLAIELFKDKPVYKKLFPMSLRPQAHDIITFWLFNTVVKSLLHEENVPWNNIMISGFALDPKSKKMSKSKGNVVDPHVMLDKYSADALRFWAAGSRLGDDLPFQEKDLVTGVKFSTKIWNAAKFVYMHLQDYNLEKPELELIDRWILAKLSRLIKESTDNFEKYEYSHTKLETEKFFWHIFCDNYLEIVKDRIYNANTRGKESRLSAQYTLYHTLLSILKLMAPITPFITEELYQSFYKGKEKEKSIHVSSWPTLKIEDEEAEKAGDFFVYVLAHVRRAKSEQNLSMKKEIKKILAKGKIGVDSFNLIKDDLKATTNAVDLDFEQLPDDNEMDYEVIVDL